MKTATINDLLPPIHPGEILREVYLEPLDMTPYALAKKLKVPRTRIERIVAEKIGITADTALRLGKFFKTTPGEAFVLGHTGGKAKAWLRAHAGDRLVVIYGDNETYYLSTLRTAVLTERPDIDAATYHKTDVAEFLRGLCRSSGAGLLIDVRTATGLQARFPGQYWDEAVLFEADGARVYDLVKLQAMVLKGEAGCGKQ